MKTVLTYGTFDLFHIGHLRLLERAAALGDALYVGISSDEFNLIKGKKTAISYDDRADIVGAIRCVAGVFREDNWDQKRNDITRLNADIFVMGDDWAGKFDDLCDLCEVSYLTRTSDISTTELKSTLSRLKTDKVVELKRSVEDLQGLITQLTE